jgi:uncharacterized protein with FMN-binding domain
MITSDLKYSSLKAGKKKERWKGTENSVPVCNDNTLEACSSGHIVSFSIDSTIDYTNVNVIGLLVHQDEGCDLFNYSRHKTITLPV